jgi:hypothetical protein
VQSPLRPLGAIHSSKGPERQFRRGAASQETTRRGRCKACGLRYSGAGSEDPGFSWGGQLPCRACVTNRTYFPAARGVTVWLERGRRDAGASTEGSFRATYAPEGRPSHARQVSLDYSDSSSSVSHALCGCGRGCQPERRRTGNGRETREELDGEWVLQSQPEPCRGWCGLDPHWIEPRSLRARQCPHHRLGWRYQQLEPSSQRDGDDLGHLALLRVGSEQRQVHEE